MSKKTDFSRKLLLKRVYLKYFGRELHFPRYFKVERRFICTHSHVCWKVLLSLSFLLMKKILLNLYLWGSSMRKLADWLLISRGKYAYHLVTTTVNYQVNRCHWTSLSVRIFRHQVKSLLVTSPTCTSGSRPIAVRTTLSASLAQQLHKYITSIPALHSFRLS